MSCDGLRFETKGTLKRTFEEYACATIPLRMFLQFPKDMIYKYCSSHGRLYTWCKMSVGLNNNLIIA